MKLFRIKFEPLWPVPCGLLILAETEERALQIAKETITHEQTEPLEIKEIPLDKEGVAFYEDGNY